MVPLSPLAVLGENVLKPIGIACWGSERMGSGSCGNNSDLLEERSTGNGTTASA